MSVRLTGDWRRARRMLMGSARKLRRGMEAAVREEAKRARIEVVSGIRRQAPGGRRFEQPSPLTLASRRLEGVRGRGALRASGELLKNITYVARGLEAFVGIKASARGSDGRSLAKVADAQEHGAGPIAIPMTPAMRRFLGVLRERGGGGGSGGGGVVVVSLPPRPFLKPSFEAAIRGARRRLEAHVRRRLGFGRP